MTQLKTIRDRNIWDRQRFEIVTDDLLVTQDVLEMLRLMTLRRGCR